MYSFCMRLRGPIEILSKFIQAWKACVVLEKLFIYSVYSGLKLYIYIYIYIYTYIYIYIYIYMYIYIYNVAGPSEWFVDLEFLYRTARI